MGVGGAKCVLRGRFWASAGSTGVGVDRAVLSTFAYEAADELATGLVPVEASPPRRIALEKGANIL